MTGWLPQPSDGIPGRVRRLRQLRPLEPAGQGGNRRREQPRLAQPTRRTRAAYPRTSLSATA